MAGKSRKGNWFEEGKLEDYTGIVNYDPKDRTMALATYTRCIEHSDRMDRKDFKSVMADCIQDPSKHPQAKTLKDVVGPRQAMLEAKMQTMVDAQLTATKSLAYTENRKVEYMSEKQRNFDRPGFQPSINENSGSRIPTYSANYVTDQPITFYSESVDRGNVTFPTTFAVSSSNPFRKSFAFSSDAKTEPTSHKTESNERPTPFPTVREFGGLKSFRKRILLHVTQKEGFIVGSGRTVGKIVEKLWGMVNNNVPRVHIDDLAECLQAELGFRLMLEEKRGIITTFSDSGQYISLPEMTDFIRGSIAARSQELLDILLTSFQAEASDEGYVSETAIRARYSGDNDIAIVKVGDAVTLDDLFEYFTDCAAELGDDRTFEDMLIANWKGLQEQQEE